MGVFRYIKLWKAVCEETCTFSLVEGIYRLYIEIIEYGCPSDFS